MRTVLPVIATAVLAFAQDSRTLAKHLALDMQRLTADGNLLGARQMIPVAEQHIEKLGLAEPNAALLVNQIAMLEQVVGDYPKAERIYSKAIQKLETIDPHGLSIAILLLNLARTHLEAHDGPSEAHALAQRALSLATYRFGPDSPMLGMYYLTLGGALQQQGDRKNAQLLYERAYGGGRDSSSELGQYQVALILQSLGMIEALERKWEDASRHLNEAITLHIETNGPNTSNLIRPYLSLARLQMMRKEWTPAGDSVAKARSIAGTQLGADHPIKVEILSLSVEVARRSRNYEQARQWERQLRSLRPQRPSSIIHVSDLARQVGK